MSKQTKEQTADGEVKSKQVEITKFHPLVAHEVGETPFLEEEFANEWIEKGYAKAVK